MVGMLLIGLLAAIGQDRFYTFLNGKGTEDVAITQAWAIRVGTAFAFLFKTVLVAVVAKAFCLGFWFTIRRDAIRVGTIDAVSNVLGNPFLVFNYELLTKRSSLVFLAVIAWLIPLCAVFSPGTLTG